jgi:ubiquinone/menaquinone biosynthesis C-methylase UbiE
MQIPTSLAWQRWLFETLYSNRYLYRFASTIPFAGQWRNWQRLILVYLYGCDVLELGCGLGDLLADMIEAGYNCRAIENSQEMVDAARSTLRERSLGEPIWIIQGQAQRLPFANASFDTVVSTFPNEYIYDPGTLAEVERVLRPGGRLVILIGAKLLPVNPLQSFLLIFQALIYGPSILFTRSRELDRKRSPNPSITTENISNANFGKRIPLEQYRLCRRCECVCNDYWEAYIVIGEKQ